MNNSTTPVIDTLDLENYDHTGEIIYTIVTILFYSLSLFCLLILSLDPDDRYHDKGNVYRNSRTTKAHHSSQTDVLNTLSDQSVREKYWRIYFGNDKYQCQSENFQSAESKRVSFVSQLVVELKNEMQRQTSQHQELDELNEIKNSSSLHTPPVPQTPSFLSKFRRARSTSVPGVVLDDKTIDNRSYEALCHTPLCKPPLITVTKYH